MHRRNGNVASNSVKLQTIKWNVQDFAKASEGQLPMGTPAEEWSYGDLEAGFSEAKVVLDESFVTASYSHLSQEPRSAMAYWQNGKCYVLCLLPERDERYSGAGQIYRHRSFPIGIDS